MKKLIVGNWKMNGSEEMLERFLGSNSLVANDEREVVICPPVLYLGNNAKGSQSIALGAQDCSLAEQGAYTGDISAQMLAKTGVRYILIGHSERRRYQRETNDTCASKVMTAQKSGIVPIFCVGENRDQYEKNLTADVLIHQLEPLKVRNIDFGNLVIAYEPVWSIGTGLVPELDVINGTMNTIKSWLVEEIGFAKANAIRLLYGGSVTDSNAEQILSLEPVDGVLVGGASLKLDSFAAIANAA